MPITVTRLTPHFAAQIDTRPLQAPHAANDGAGRPGGVHPALNQERGIGLHDPLRRQLHVRRHANGRMFWFMWKKF